MDTVHNFMLWLMPVWYGPMADCKECGHRHYKKDMERNAPYGWFCDHAAYERYMVNNNSYL